MIGATFGACIAHYLPQGVIPAVLLPFSDNLGIWSDMHNRMKEALVLLGRLPRAVVRPPLVKLDNAEINRLRLALAAAGLLTETADCHAA